MTGPDRLRTRHADRERVIQALKNAFVSGRLNRDEFDVRAGGALTARTYSELAALTADIPAAGDPAWSPAPGRRPVGDRASLWQRHPVIWGVGGFGGCVAVAFGLILFAANVLDPNDLGNPYHPWSGLCGLAAFVALITGLCLLIYGLGTAEHQRRVRRQLPLPPGERRADMYRVDITADLNDEDDAGFVWTFLDKARDPGTRVTSCDWTTGRPGYCGHLSRGIRGLRSAMIRERSGVGLVWLLVRAKDEVLQGQALTGLR